MAGYRIAWEALDDGFQHTWHVCLSCESTGGLQLPLLSVLMASRVLRAPFSGVRHRLSRCCSLCRGKGSRWWRCSKLSSMAPKKTCLCNSNPCQLRAGGRIRLAN